MVDVKTTNAEYASESDALFQDVGTAHENKDSGEFAIFHIPEVTVGEFDFASIFGL